MTDAEALPHARRVAADHAVGLPAGQPDQIEDLRRPWIDLGR
jgi:hypothetical protein